MKIEAYVYGRVSVYTGALMAEVVISQQYRTDLTAEEICDAIYEQVSSGDGNITELASKLIYATGERYLSISPNGYGHRKGKITEGRQWCLHKHDLTSVLYDDLMEEGITYKGYEALDIAKEQKNGNLLHLPHPDEVGAIIDLDAISPA
ncbi:MAG: hypothetical protein ACNI26_16900 [Terasakiella sp.]|uniref:hypothetical protein n=1 Tax=unclassified Terasakiella TaxID=2614952 RepID=UPI003AFF8341